MTAKKRASKAADKGMDAMESTVRLYLIEHGGAPFVKHVNDDGSSTESPLFPTTLPSLAEAMAEYPCTDQHMGDRDPAICCTARRVKNGAKFDKDNDLTGPGCGRSRKVWKGTHYARGCPIESCPDYPKKLKHIRVEAE